MHQYSGEDPRRTAALGTLAVLAVLFAIFINWLASQQSTIPSWLWSAPAVASSFGLLLLALEEWAWRWPVVQRLGLVRTPVIRGKYEGLLTSAFGTRPVSLHVDQTWSRIAIRFQVFDPESSTSYSMTAGLAITGEDQARLTYTYRNQTRPGIADLDMNDHDGTAELEFHSDGQVTGRYYNFRGRQGTLTLASCD